MLFDWPAWVIVAALLMLMLAMNEVGFRAGHRRQHEETELGRAVSWSLKGSIVGLIALLLGFSFSATTTRYDMRLRLVLDLANAVGTAHLRAGLIDEPAKSHIRENLRRYVGLRLESYSEGLNTTARERTGHEIERQLAELWKSVEEANRQNPEALRRSLLTPAANEVIDLDAARGWANRNHVPDAVLVLLLAGVLVVSILIGHSSGQGGKRHTGLWIATDILVGLILFVILDFDRPRRGLIRVDQTPLMEVYSSMGGDRNP